MYKMYMKWTLGILEIKANEEAITNIEFVDEMGIDVPNAICEEAKKQLQEYFEGNRKCFNVPFFFEGTPFQHRVWDALCQIPYGETRTYMQIAQAVGNPKASRAIGMANHHNPIGIIIPCHRVIGANGTLTGYAGGLDKKAFLLNLEKQLSSCDTLEL